MKKLNLVLIVGLLILTGCEDDTPKQNGEKSSRFAAVKRGTSEKAARAFCEKTYPPGGEGVRKFSAPPEKPLPVKVAAPAKRDGAWRWINLWATWCKPCVEEMPLLGRWSESLTKDGVALDFELWSVDEGEEDLKKWLGGKKLPGSVHWVKDAAASELMMESLGIDKASAIPVHALVDPNDQLRCVRVGSVHDKDYSAVKTLLTGS